MIMPPKTRTKSTNLWHRCDKCNIVFLSKDIVLHQDGSCPPCDENWSHSFIKKKVLHSWVGEGALAELLPSLPPDELENIVCVSTAALQLCKFIIGEPVLLEVQGQVFIKIIWPCTDKSMTSVLLTKEARELLCECQNAPVTVRKIPYPVPPAKEIVIIPQNPEGMPENQISDIIFILHHKYFGKYLRPGSFLLAPFYGRMLKFLVQQIKPFSSEEHSHVPNDSPGALDTITDCMQNMTFDDLESASASCSTPISKQQSFSQRPTLSSVSSSEQTPIRRKSRNMLEDSYAGSSTEESRDDISESFTDSSMKQVPMTSSGFCHIVHSSEWRMKNSNMSSEEERATDENLLESIGGLSYIIDEIKDIMSSALDHSSLKNRGLRIPKGVLLFGPSGTGKTKLAHALAQDSTASVHVLVGSELFSKVLGETDARLRLFFEKATSSGPAVIILDEVDSLCSKKAHSSGSEVERRVITSLCTLLDGLSSGNKRVFVIAITSRPDSIESSLRRPGRLDREIEVPVPTPDGRLEILKKLLRPVPHILSEAELLSVARAAHGFVGADLASLVSQAGTYAFKNSNEGDDVSIKIDHVQWALSRVNPSAMREVLVDVPNVYWSDIGGQDELKLKLKQAVEWPLSHPEAFERLGIRPPRGVLMFGPPGCSKTMIAKALATESKLNFLSIKGPELFSKWVGESERAVREVFRRARQVAPAIIFFDEIDALGGERGNGNGGGSNVQERVLAQLLTEMDGVTALGNVTVVAATNRPDRIDKALLRPGRLDRIVYVPLPEAETRKQILELQLKKMPICKDLDTNYLVEKTNGYSGAEVLAVCHEAALRALQENIDAKVVTTQHFVQALSLVTPRTPVSLIELYENYVSR